MILLVEMTSFLISFFRTKTSSFFSDRYFVHVSRANFFFYLSMLVVDLILRGPSRIFLSNDCTTKKEYSTFICCTTSKINLKDSSLYKRI